MGFRGRVEGLGLDVFRFQPFRFSASAAGNFTGLPCRGSRGFSETLKIKLWFRV